MVVRFFCIGILVAAAYFARQVLLVSFLAIVLSTLFSFPVDCISKFIPRSLSVVLTLILLFGAGTGMTLIAIPTVSKQTGLLKEQIPGAAEKVYRLISKAEKSAQSVTHSGGGSKAQDNRGGVADSITPGGAASQIAKTAVPVVLNLAELVTSVVLIIVLAAFLVSDPHGYREGIKVFIPKEFEKNFDEAWNRASIGLRHWVGGIIVEMFVMGTLAGIGLWIAQIDGAFTLGLITFFATFIPYLGAIASSIPGLLMGLAKSPQHFFYAGCVYIGVHIFEGYIVSPFVMKHAIRLRPALLLFWQAFMGAIFGVIGVIISTPLLACLKAIIGYFYVEIKLNKPAPKV